jgi:hypothetical protein
MAPLGFLPRLRQACQGRPAGAEGSPSGSPSPRQSQEERLALNRVFISGVIAADPVRDRGRDGRAVLLVLIAFPAPERGEGEERAAVASQEVEVPARLLRARQLRAGASVFLTGALSGGGGILATEVHVGPAPEASA